MIKAVLFDLDGTLYDRDALARSLFEQQYRAFADELRGISRERFLREVYEMDEHGHGDKESGYRNLVRAWRLDDALAPRLIEHFWDTFERLCVSSDDTTHTLRRLRERGLRLGVVTNGGQAFRQRRKLASLGIEHSFDVVLVSGEEGVSKPDPEIFRRALARCGVAAHEALFVGDHPVADVEGAHRAGLVAVWKYAPHWPSVTIEVPVIRTLEELLPLASP